MSEKFPTMVVGVVVAILLITSLAIPVIADANTGSSASEPNPDGHGITLALQKNNFAVDVDFTDNGDDTFTINGDTYDMQPQILMAWNDGVVYIDDDYRTVILTKNGNDQSSKIVTEFTANLTTTLDFADDNNWSASFQMPSYIYTPDANGEYSSWVDTTDLKKNPNDTVIAVGSYAGVDCYYNSQNTGVIQNLPLGLVAETDYTANEINSVIFVALTDEEPEPVDPATLPFQPLDPSIIEPFEPLEPFQPNDPVIIMAVPTPTYTDGDWGYDLITSGYDTTVAKIVSYSGAGGGAITIPATVGGYDVKEVGKGGNQESVFDTSLSATDLIISNGISIINRQAFRGCSGFTGSLTIPNTVTSIGYEAFFGCGFTGSLTIPDSVTNLSGAAFQSCQWFTSLTLPDSITNIDSYTFQNCKGLTGTLTIPNTVTSLGPYAFSDCRNLTTLVLSNSLTNLGDHAFNNCVGLTGTVTIPASLTRIDSSSFYSCNGITSLVLPEGVTYIGNGAFNRCSGLTSLTLPNSLTEISTSGFAGCTGLTGNLTIPDNVTKLGTSAFSGCTGITSLILPDSLTNIGINAFNGCTGIKSLIISVEQGTTINSNSFNNTTNLKEVLNLGSLELTTTSYGLNADSVQDYIDACCYLAPVEIAGSDSGSLSVILNVIPILMILGVIMFVAGFVLYRRF